MKYRAIIYSIKWLAERGVKTAAFMSRVIDALVRDLYNGVIESDEFQNELFDLVESQFRRAFNEGMRNNGLDPAIDMTEEWESIYQNMVADQLQYIERFASDILDGAKNEVGKDQFMARADLWANQYDSTVTQSELITAPKDLNKIWVFGDTDHCDTCQKLNGIIATSADWLQSGYIPGEPGSEKLDCHGYRCQCRLESTDEKVTPGGIP